MQNLSDNELDGKFRKANSEQRFPFDESAWKKLDAQLDAAHGTGWNKWKNTLLVTSVVLVGSVVSFVALSPSKQLPLTNTERASAQEEEVINLDVQAESKVSFKENSQLNLFDATNKESYSRDNAKSIFVADKTNKVILRSTTNPDTANSNKAIQLSSVEIQESDKQRKTYSPLSFSNDSSLQVSVLSEIIVADSTTVEKEQSFEEKKHNQVSVGKVAVRIYASPDFSASNFSTIGNTGTNVGFSIEYFLRDRFSLSLGLIQSRKYYETSDVTYGYRTAQFMEGDCRIWDLPINATYYFPFSGTTSFYTSAGFTSYLMKHEKYDYYPNADNRNYKYSQEIKGKNKEWFSVLNVSVGLQKQLTKSWSVQAEPFVKVPLGGIGEGNIALSSIGAFLGLKYQFKK